MNANEVFKVESLEPPPQAVLKLLKTIQSVGYEAFIVGGAVRDRLLGRPTHDYDVATNAHPQIIVDLFERTIPTGLQHGTVTVIIDKTPIEVTTYRIDQGYSDGRHPDRIDFTSNLREDLARRDFTINAIAWDPIHQVIADPFDGQGDLQRRLVKAVGKAHDRFSEDGLRALRAVRFATVLDFELENDTRLAIASTLSTFRMIAKERIRVELVKTLMSQHPAQGFKDLASTGLLDEIMPEISPLKAEQLNALQALTSFSLSEEDQFTARFATLLQYCDLKTINQVMNNLRFSVNESRAVSCLLNADRISKDDPVQLHMMIAQIGRDRWTAFRSWHLANQSEVTTGIQIAEQRKYLEDPLYPVDLKIDGHNICKELEIQPSRIVKTIQNDLLQLIWLHKLENTTDSLIEELHRRRDNHVYQIE